MISALTKALGQMGDPKLQAVFWKGVIGSIVAFILLYAVLWGLLSQVAWTELPFYIGDFFAWMGDSFDVFGGVFFGGTILIATYFLFPAVMIAVVGIFLDDVCEAVEDKHYPHLGKARKITIVDSLWNALKFVGVVALVNIVAAPFYILTFWVIGLGLVLYYLINGYLIGREYYELVAFRRMSPKNAHRLRRAHRGQIMLAGAAVAFAMTIPIVNILTPIIAAAMMDHLFMRLPRRAEFMDAEPVSDLAKS